MPALSCHESCRGAPSIHWVRAHVNSGEICPCGDVPQDSIPGLRLYSADAVHAGSGYWLYPTLATSWRGGSVSQNLVLRCRCGQYVECQAILWYNDYCRARGGLVQAWCFGGRPILRQRAPRPNTGSTVAWVRERGVSAQPEGLDLSERGMRVRFVGSVVRV